MSEYQKDTLQKNSKTNIYTTPKPRQRHIPRPIPRPRPIQRQIPRPRQRQITQQTHRQIPTPMPPKTIQDKLTNANDWNHGGKCKYKIKFTANLDKATLEIPGAARSRRYHFKVEWNTNGTFRLVRKNGDYHEFNTNLILGKNESIYNIGYCKNIIRAIDIK